MAEILNEGGPIYLEEAWGILPKSLSVVDTLEGQKLYSSEAVRQKFISAISNQKILAPVSDKIANLINRQIIVPCFASGNLIKFMAHKFFSDQMSKSILGFYFSERNMIYILLDNHTKFAFFMSNKALSSVTLHELMHYASWNLKTRFFSLHKDTFRKYFRTFYKLQFNINVPDKIIDEIVLFVLKNFEYPKQHSPNFLARLADLMYVRFEGAISNDDERDEMVRHTLAAVKLFLVNPNSFIQSIQSGDEVVSTVVANLHKSYKVLNIRDPKSLTIQELIYPSEIICIQSQFRPMPSHYQTIKAL